MIFIIYESFEKLDDKKKISIINAGFQIFGEFGYNKASVDAIIEKANISKGSLFYYFESKKNYYLYLYDYCGQQMEKLVDDPDLSGKPSYMKYTDFFERLNAIQLLKRKHAADYPYMYSFMKKAVYETSSSVKTEISNINNRYVKERGMSFFQNIDYYKFKDGIDPMMIIQLLTWCSEGCANQVILKNRLDADLSSKHTDFSEITNLYDQYVELFRNNFYKEEYLDK